jgi:hypothetical protein
MKDALTDEFYLSYWDYLKLIGIGSVLAIGVTYIVLQLSNGL